MRFSYFVVYGVDYLTRDAWDESCWQCVTKKKKKARKDVDTLGLLCFISLHLLCVLPVPGDVLYIFHRISIFFSLPVIRSRLLFPFLHVHFLRGYE